MNDLLPQIPLKWLMTKAIAHGLKFKGEIVIDGDVNACPVRDSYGDMAYGIYKVLTLWNAFYRPIGVEAIDIGDAVITTINETIDATVFERWRKDKTYRPKNLSDWANRRNVDPSALIGSVSLDDLTIVPD